MSTSRIEYNEEYFRGLDDYWRQVSESDGFDIEGIRGPQGVAGLKPFNCQGLGSNLYPYPSLVNCYARLGLHRYNMKEGTKFELHHLIKFNMRFNFASSFYITLAARRTVTGRSMQTFQVLVDEKSFGPLDVICSISRVKGETTGQPLTPHHDSAVLVDGLPDWPSDDDAFNDTERFYLVEGSELMDTYRIRLYLELAVSGNDMRISNEDISKLKIVKVAIETTEEVPLKAKSSIIYIVFKGLATSGIGEHVERKAIIKSVFNEGTGFLYLKGNLCKGEEDLNVMSVEETLYRYRQSIGLA